MKQPAHQAVRYAYGSVLSGNRMVQDSRERAQRKAHRRSPPGAAIGSEPHRPAEEERAEPPALRALRSGAEDLERSTRPGRRGVERREKADACQPRLCSASW